MFDIFRTKLGTVLNILPRTDDDTPALDTRASERVLDRYEAAWSDITAINHENGRLADEIAVDVQAIHAQCERDNKTLTCLLSLVSDGGLNKQLDRCVSELTRMEREFREVEEQLNELEVYLNAVDACNKAYIQAQKDEMEERRRQQLIIEQREEERMEREKILDEHMQIVSKTFDDKFKNDLKAFKERGIIGKPSSPIETVHLEDVDLDVNDDELAEFLDD